MASRGMNLLLWHFTDDQGCMLEFESVKGIASDNAYSKGEMKGLVKYARERGVEVVPEVATLGHCLYITRLEEFGHLNESDSVFTGMCPVAEETRGVVKKLIEEAAEVFDSPNVHVGLDEANYGEHPLTREALKTRTKGELFGEHVKYVHSVVSGVGKRMWMWGDGLLKHPEITPTLPHDIVVLNWQYRPEAPVSTTNTLLNWGFDVVLCPALISHDQTLYPGEEFALPNVRTMKGHEGATGEGKVLGMVTTVWTGVRFMSGSLWPALHVAAEVMRDGEGVDFGKSLCAFAGEFYGMAGSASAADWARVCGEVMSLSPGRLEWVAVGKGQLPEGMSAADVEAKGKEWGKLAAELRKMSAEVRKNRRAYRTFRLMVEVVAHWYGMAARRKMTASAAERMGMKGENLLKRVEGVWDAERYADDPKKYGPPVEHFRDDHLIPLLKAGLERVWGMAPDEARQGRVSVSVTGSGKDKSLIG